MTIIHCNRCNCELTGEGGRFYDGCGVCDNCGDDLCADCSQGFDADGYCKKCHDEAHQGKHVDELPAVPAMLTTNVHDVIGVTTTRKLVKGNSGDFTIVDYDFIGANFIYRVTAFMKGGQDE